jgi:hypothetical protein
MRAPFVFPVWRPVVLLRIKNSTLQYGQPYALFLSVHVHWVFAFQLRACAPFKRYWSGAAGLAACGSVLNSIRIRHAIQPTPITSAPTVKIITLTASWLRRRCALLRAWLT